LFGQSGFFSRLFLFHAYIRRERFALLQSQQLQHRPENNVAQVAKEKIASHLRATPKQMDRELRAFSRAARILSSDHPRLIENHPKEWVGIYDGKVCATGKSFAALVSKLKKHGFSPSDAIIRYIDTSGRKLIL
jgi:hypothetical protein